MNELNTWENLVEAFRLYRKDIYTFIFYKSNRSKDFAEDIVQETFEKAWVKRKLFKGGSLKNWLFQIAINTARDSLKRNSRVESIIEEPSYNKDDNYALLEHISNSLKQLAAQDRDLITLHYILGLNSQEISDIYNKSEPGIRVAIHRAFTKLKKISNENIK